MDRVTISALTVAGASVILSLMLHHDARSSAEHAILLALLLAIVAFPEAIEAGFRSTLRGSARSGEEPTPSIMIQIAGCGLFVIVIVVHHAVGYGRIRV